LDHLNFLGFGLDLANDVDVDNNQYPDLLIGSYLSDKAVLLRFVKLIVIVYFNQLN